MTVFLICVLTLLLLRQTSIEGVSNEYAARCIFDDNTSISCQVALFSAFSFDINGTLSYSSSKYCQKSLETARNISDILIVNRGDCSFEDKVKNAERDGYIALIIVNTDNTTFPAGASEGYSSKIPVLTIGNTFLDELDEKNECKLKYLQLSYTARPKPSSQGDEGGGSSSAPSLSSMICLLLSILVLAATVNVSTTHYRYLVGMLLFVLLISLRMGTFRSISHVNGASEYNHNETDERIFATLIQSVSKNMWDYKLHASTIEQFRLSKENYSTDIFIHPPFFVYSSAILQYYTGISLPSVIICHHIITALCIPLLITGMASDSIPHAVVENLSVLSLVLFLLCPISAFCSQKIWIDNCLMMTVTVSATAHVHLTNYATKSLRSAYFSSLVSGLVLGGLALNTKITAIAIGPFLGSYTAYKVLQRVWKDKLPVSTASWDIFTHGVCILVGMCVSHGPWVYTYHRVTGRLLPSAWPSKSMLEASAFVRSAVNKPGHTYLLTLLTISPIALVGLVHTMQNMYLLTHLCLYLLTGLLTHLLTHSLTGLLTHLLTYSLTHSLTH